MSNLNVGDKVYYLQFSLAVSGATLRTKVRGTLIGLPSSDASKGGNNLLRYVEVLTHPDENGYVDVKLHIVNIRDLNRD